MVAKLCKKMKIISKINVTHRLKNVWVKRYKNNEKIGRKIYIKISARLRDRPTKMLFKVASFLYYVLKTSFKLKE